MNMLDRDYYLSLVVPFSYGGKGFDQIESIENDVENSFIRLIVVVKNIF